METILLKISMLDLVANGKDRKRPLTTEQKGQLLDCIIAYALGEEMPQIDDRVADRFDMLSEQIDYNMSRYNEICEKRRAAGAKGGQKKKENALANATNANTDVANANFATDDVANSTLHKHKPKHKQINKEQPPKGGDKKEENQGSLFPEEEVAETKTIIDGRNIYVRKNGTKFIAPTEFEVEQFFHEKGYLMSPKAFIDYYESADWHFRDGKPVKNWKQCAATWASIQKQRDLDLRRQSSNELAHATISNNTYEQF